MAQYQMTVDDATLEGLFQRDGGIAKLVESVVNHKFSKRRFKNS